jgi:hypothetical protein
MGSASPSGVTCSSGHAGPCLSGAAGAAVDNPAAPRHLTRTNYIGSIKDLTAELDRLYARYRQLEEQKRPLLERVSELGPPALTPFALETPQHHQPVRHAQHRSPKRIIRVTRKRWLRRHEAPAASGVGSDCPYGQFTIHDGRRRHHG